MIDKESLFAHGAQSRVKEFESKEIDGETFFIREINARELDELQVLGARMMDTVKARKPFRALAVTKFLCDADGLRIFKDHEAQSLQNLSARLIDEIFTAGWKYNKVGELDDAVEEAEKN
jgi:hypothetical protein